MRLTIVIEEGDEEGLRELFAVGVNDLIEYFLPKGLHIKPKDVKACWFEHNDNPDGIWKGEEYHVTSHPDNLYLKDTCSTEQKKQEASNDLFDAVAEDFRSK